ncbi:MAG: MBL fold metallo-hydrolase [Synergistaceae bacterium]|jgi:glyoxylase-like metal-dependent hydrolase (beta-lactamase superfamily II)|nr:MBL fold metallo-hydrolase [Synergistaceae bacterium]
MRYFICAFLALAVMGLRATSAMGGESGAGVEAYKIGDASVWAVADSMGDRDMNVFADADPALLQQYAPSGKSPSAIMTFAVKLGQEVILIDTGLGEPSGDRASGLLSGLSQIGISPESVTLILVTHMHADHIGGLEREGQKVFPSARVILGRVERDFWLGEKSMEQFPDRKANFEMARRVADLYGDAVEALDFDAEATPGIRILDARGHTPGHSAFLLESGGEKLLFWGDLVHAAALQFPRPDINARYDMMPLEASAARARFMEMAAAENLPIAGMHLPFPGVGRVEKTGNSSYVYKPGL